MSEKRTIIIAATQIEASKGYEKFKIDKATDCIGTIYVPKDGIVPTEIIVKIKLTQ